MEPARRRIAVLEGHLTASASAAAPVRAQPCAANSSVLAGPKKMEVFRWNGWGYKDTEFRLNPAGQVELTGDRYLFSGQVLPNFRPWVEKEIGIDVTITSPSQPKCPVPAPVRNAAFVSAVEPVCRRVSFEDEERLFHGHGHTCQEMLLLRGGSFKRVPDCVVYPGRHEDVEAVVAAALAHNVLLIPFGGGTNVTQSLLCPEDETRMIVSVDMTLMNRVKWVDRENMLACVEAGAIGRELERELALYGVCTGHEPDSVEFSSVGGWVATRASGMKKNIYGNIEDLVVRIKVVTAAGTFEKCQNAPRQSTGPDLHEFILGSEGTLGIVTEVVFKVRPLPAARKYGSIVFPDFESGVAFMYEVGIRRLQPASIRLMDNMQFQFGMALKPATHSTAHMLIDRAKKIFVTKIKGFEPEKMTAVTLLFEGEPEECRRQEQRLYSLASKFRGLRGGAENGERGYFLTYVIAYLRDFGFHHQFIAESFETSVPWSKVLTICQSVKARIVRSAAEKGIQHKPFVSCRVTQTYDTGACIYFYFGFMAHGLADPLGKFSEIEDEAREEILASGGSVSHHHGIGKLRRRFLPDAVSPTGVEMLRAVRQALDPKGIFRNGNLL